MKGWMLLLSCLALAIVTASNESSAAGPRVLVIGPAADHSTVKRVRDELSLLGFEVVVEPLTGVALDQAAARVDAVGALRVEHWPPEIILWVQPQSPTEESAELKVSDSLTDAAEPALLALRAVELLRAKLLPVPPDSKPSPPPAAPTAPQPVAPAPAIGRPPPAPAASLPQPVAPQPFAPVKPPAPPPEPGEQEHDGDPLGLALFAAPSLMLSPGGVPPAPVIRLGASYRIAWRIQGELTAQLPTVAAVVNSELPAAMELRTLFFGGGAAVSLLDPATAASASAGLGMAAMLLWYSGEAEAPLRAAEGSSWVAAPYAVLAGGYRFDDHIGIRAELLGALLRPEPILRIAGQEIASFGQPAVFASLGLEVLL